MGTGDRGPTVSDQEILAVFARVDDRQLRTREVAGELPIRVEDAADRLDDLRERGLLESDDDEPRDRWRLAPDAEDVVTIPDEEVETEVEAQATKVTDAAASPREEETPDTPPPDPDADPVGPVHGPPGSEIDAIDPSGSPAEEDRRREAIRRSYLYLQKRGTADREDFETDVYPEAPGLYDRPGAWWEDLVEPGFQELPGVEAMEGSDGWRFVGEDDETAEE